jgi:hypothetical protein
MEGEEILSSWCARPRTQDCKHSAQKVLFLPGAIGQVVLKKHAEKVMNQKNSFLCIIGVVSEDHVPKYAAYKAQLRTLSEGAASGTPFSKTTILELDETHGFGFAVRAALDFVHTPYVMIVQVWDIFTSAVCLVEP